jgi:hypothetical protein
VPSLDLRFADNKSLVDAVTGASLVTFTRASSGTFVNSAGVIQTATTDVPRFDHDPITGESLGLLVEEARTNSISNNTMVGAAAGTPGTLPTGWPFQSAGVSGLSVSIVGTGTESGIAYLDWKVSGTATAATGATICFGRASALTAQTWTTSSYLKLAAGSLSGVTGITLDLIEETAAAVFVTGAGYSISLPTTNSLITQRPTASRTFSGGATVALVRTNLSVAVSSGSTVDITLRIGLPQLEQGAFATSPIPTTTAAVTRSADVASITGSAFSLWYNATEGTVFAEGFTFGGSSTNCLVSIDDNTTSNRIQLRRNIIGPASTLRMVSSGGSIDTNLTTGTALGLNKIAAGVAASNQNLASNGVLATGITSITPMPVVTQVNIGNGVASTHLNGHLLRLTFWPTRLSNASLQSITQ